MAHRTGEPHGEQHQVDIHFKLRARYGLELWCLAYTLALELCFISLPIAAESHRGYAPVAQAPLLMLAFHPQLHGPQRPGRVRRSRIGRFRQDLELRNMSSLLSV